MNKKGFMAFFLFMMFVVLIIIGLALSPTLIQVSNVSQSTSTDDSVGLNCAWTNLTYQEQANCTSTDGLPFFYIGIVFGLAFIILKATGG